MRRRLGAWIAAAYGVIFMAGVPAEAAQRYVSPGGGNAAPCTQASPCSLTTGVNAAGSSDEVIVTPGTYTEPSSLINSGSSLSVHGQAGQARPVINTSGVVGLQLMGNSAVVRDLTINHTGTNFGLITSGTSPLIDHVDVHSTNTACGATGTVRDSLCVSTGNQNGYSLITGGGTFDVKLRNVTTVAGGNAVGLAIAANGPASISVDARNVIAKGSGSGADVVGLTTVGTGFVGITMHSSNFDQSSGVGAGTETVTPPGSGDNQTAAPVFSDTVNYLQAPGSPTIDKGTTDADTGTTTDLNGDPRVLGVAIDIGVDEAIPAVDSTPPETTISKGPKKKTKSRKAKFTFSSSEAGSTFTCALDKKPAAPCTSPLKLKRLKRGKHKLVVTATDAAGNADASPATYRWKVKKKRRR